MALVDQAVLARKRSDAAQVEVLARAALEKERAAANLVASQVELEPTRSVLHRSAAVLALVVSRIARSRTPDCTGISRSSA